MKKEQWNILIEKLNKIISLQLKNLDNNLNYPNYYSNLIYYHYDNNKKEKKILFKYFKIITSIFTTHIFNFFYKIFTNNQ